MTTAARPSGVSPMLVRLAGERATGALLRDRGTLYLVDGQVVHAESPAAPGIDILLTASGRLRPEGWQQALDRAGAHGRVGRFLVESGQVADGELEICHLGALHDAAYFALAPSSGPTRFRYGVAHWIGTVLPVPADAVEREAARRRELLDRLWPYPDVDTAPVVRAPSRPDIPVTPRQRAVLDLADGELTPPGIARVLGRPAFHTLIDVRRLAAAGAVENPHTPAPQRSAIPARFAEAVADVSPDPDVALLRRLRDALEATL
ncbi:transcriptional regulator [Streptomyces sp. NBC_00859]|uniref:transcriptional regulator n=1 Tax=Streptomyces sp. NBC_00859 TaxID=2903682 RepID=UPI00386B0B8B|nr:transcriptional regulator [Streptomyces sp. NBC_00859]